MKPQFLELIKIALGNTCALPVTPTRYEWLSLLYTAQQQAVIGVIADGIEKLPKDQYPPQDVLLQWIGMAQLTQANYAIHCKRARELASLFSELGCHSCVLKGISIAQFYPNPSDRQGGDIDLWIDGERSFVMKWLRSKYQLDHITWHNVGVPFFKDVPVEVHFHPAWLYNPFHNFRLQRWFKKEKMNQMKRKDAMLGVATPSVKFNAVFSLIHTYRHFIVEGIGLRHIIDYYYIMTKLAVDDRPKVVLSLYHFGLKKFARGIMWVMVNVCGLQNDYLLIEPNEKEGRFILAEIEKGGDFVRFRTDYKKRNTMKRKWVMLRHYPSEITWVLPWKSWHFCWRIIHKGKLA